MQVVLNQPHAVQAGQFADFVRLTLDLAKQHNYTNIRSSQVTIWVMSKVLAFICFTEMWQPRTLLASRIRHI